MSPLLAQTTSTAETAGQPWKVESLGQPCRSLNMLAGTLVKDPKSGRELLVVTNMNEKATELILIDTENDTAELFTAPEGQGAWALNVLPDGKMILGTFFDAYFLVFDLATRSWEQSVRVPGETYLWNGTFGHDGRLYGGTYPGGKLVGLDLKDFTLEEYGAGAPPNLYCRQVSTLPDGRIFCHYETERPVNMIYDPAANTYTTAPESMQEGKFGVSWRGRFIMSSRQCYTGSGLEPCAPLPVDLDKNWTVNLELSTSETLYVNAGPKLYRVLPGDGGPAGGVAGSSDGGAASQETTMPVELVTNVYTRGGRIMGLTRDGASVGRRGQDYFVLRKGARTPELRQVPVKSNPRPTLFLQYDGRGGLWGGPWFGQNLFVMDTQTRQTTVTGVMTNSGGEVYDVCFHDGKLFAASYAGGEIIQYDPTLAWDEFHQKNPRTILKLEEEGFIRPSSGIVPDPSGKNLYCGWWAKYGTYGGAITITDPVTRKNTLIRNPLGAQCIGGIAAGRSRYYAATTVMANGLPNSPETPRFGAFEQGTNQLVKKLDLPRRVEKTTTQSVPMAWDARTDRVLLAADGRPMLFDNATLSFVQEERLKSAPDIGTFVIRTAGDGKAYFGSGMAIMRMDLSDGSCRELARLPDVAWTLCLGRPGEVYAATEEGVYRLTER